MSLDQPTKQLGSVAYGEVLQLSGMLTALATAASGVHESGDYMHAIVPQGFKLEDISKAVEKMQPTPRRKSGTVQLKDLDSLIQYCNDQNIAEALDDARMGSAYGYLYADPDNRKITAVFNDNRDAIPGWRDHRAEFKAEYTPEFSKWISKNAVQFTQTEFAEFIEDNMADITEPQAADLLEMATTIQSKTDINFSSAKRLQNGQVQLGYSETIDARAGANGAMEIPKEFSLGLRIFKNGEGYRINARLKYRLHSGSIKFWFELDRVERAMELAFTGYVDALREKAPYQVLLGTP
jgi:uncharacterized protein YfdQ (DUF2303 family)